MADEHEVRRINWGEVFGFTQIFRSFKLAMHFSKIGIALAAIVLVFSFGWLLDVFWAMGGSYAHPQEISRYVAPPAGTSFTAWKDDWKDGRIRRAAELVAQSKRNKATLEDYTANLRRMLAGEAAAPQRAATPPGFDEAVRDNLGRAGLPPDAANAARTAAAGNIGVSQHILDALDARIKESKEEPENVNVDALARSAKSWSSLLGDAEDAFDDEVSKVDSYLKDLQDQSIRRLKDVQDKDTETSREQKDKALDQLKKDLALAWPALTATKVDFQRQLRLVRGQKVFNTFMAFETNAVENALSGIRHGNIFGGMDRYQQLMRQKREASPVFDASGKIIDTQTGLPTSATPADQTPGFVFWVLMAVHGFCWLMAEHWVFAALVMVFMLGVWALMGGAIYRIAALQAAREEKISIAQAIRFSAGKFASFVTAPLLPLAIVLVCGLLLALGGFLFGNYGGGILLGILFFIAILLGLAIAFLLAGFIAGGALMYPTIAVEGSDSFDAISRSFSYVLSRPWRAGLYALVALVYGTITYLFVRLFIFITLTVTHYFLGWGMLGDAWVFGGGKTLGPDADKLDVLWAPPTFDSLWGSFNWQAMSGWESVGAFMIGAWVFLAAAVVGAYLISFFASSSTVIYLLLRRNVDATDMDEVYVEESDQPPSGEGSTVVQATEVLVTETTTTTAAGTTTTTTSATTAPDQSPAATTTVTEIRPDEPPKADQQP